MNIQDFSRKYFGPQKYAEPFITDDRIADIAENPNAPQSNNLIAPQNLATDVCAKDFAVLIRPLYPSLKVVQGPAREPFDDGGSLQHMVTSGPRTAAWLTFHGFNQYGAEVHPYMLVGRLVEVFSRMSTPEAAFSQVISLMNFAAFLEPSPTTE